MRKQKKKGEMCIWHCFEDNRLQGSRMLLKTSNEIFEMICYATKMHSLWYNAHQFFFKHIVRESIEERQQKTQKHTHTHFTATVVDTFYTVMIATRDAFASLNFKLSVCLVHPLFQARAFFFRATIHKIEM